MGEGKVVWGKKVGVCVCGGGGGGVGKEKKGGGGGGSVCVPERPPMPSCSTPVGLRVQDAHNQNRSYTNIALALPCDPDAGSDGDTLRLFHPD